MLKKEHVTYTIAATDALLGEARKHAYRIHEIFLSSSNFSGSLGHALAVYLHEISHMHYGFDGQRTFSDALTRIIENIVDQREIVNKYADKWKQLVQQIATERHATPDQSVESYIDNLSEEQLRSIVKQLPQNALLPLISQTA
jgi:hypothetical protein